MLEHEQASPKFELESKDMRWMFFSWFSMASIFAFMFFTRSLSASFCSQPRLQQPSLNEVARPIWAFQMSHSDS